MLRAFVKLRRTLVAAIAHDVFGSAKAAAYSAILCLFPTILLFTTVLALAPGVASARAELKFSLMEILPDDTTTLLHSYFSHQRVRTGQVLFSSTLISLFAAMGLMLSLMEGFRRAYDLPRRDWPFWVERVVAFALIPSCLAPLAFATLFVAFGHQIEIWVLTNTDHVVGKFVLLLWRMVRWTIGLSTTVFLLAVIYHFGTPRRQPWRCVMPGAFGAALTWFLSTLAYGFYIQRFSSYSLVYGSLGTLIATLVWLYITSLSVLFGAEFNAQVHPKPPRLEPFRVLREEAKPEESAHTTAIP
jgi:membrane protein